MKVILLWSSTSSSSVATHLRSWNGTIIWGRHREMILSCQLKRASTNLIDGLNIWEKEKEQPFFSIPGCELYHSQFHIRSGEKNYRESSTAFLIEELKADNFHTANQCFP